MEKKPWLLILLVVAGLAYAWHTGELQIPGDVAPDTPTAVSGSVSPSDLYRALADEVAHNRIEDTDDLISIADDFTTNHGMQSVKSELESKCGIQAGKPKALIADPSYAKQVAEKLRGGL